MEFKLTEVFSEMASVDSGASLLFCLHAIVIARVNYCLFGNDSFF